MEHDQRGLIFQALPDRGVCVKRKEWKGEKKTITHNCYFFVAASTKKEKHVAIWKSENH